MKIPARLKVQDEIQHRLIAALFSHEIGPRLVFHGGTMLRVCGVPDYRFSEDLDMLLEGLSKKDFYSVLVEEIFPDVEKQMDANLSIESDSYSPKDQIRWECRNEVGAMDLDIETVDGTSDIETEIFRMQPNHEGLPEDLAVRCYSIPQVLATKFACVSDRVEGRDVYDMWRLSDNGKTLREAWVLHRKAYTAAPSEIPPSETARHLHTKIDRFSSAVAIAAPDLAISLPVAPREMVKTIVERCLSLQGMSPLVPVHL